MTHAPLPAETRLRARTVVVDRPGELLDLLDRLGPDGFAWFDGDEGFVTSGVAAMVGPADAAALLGAIDHDAAPGAPSESGPRAVGALPFSGAGALTIPSTIVGCTADGRGWLTEIDASSPTLHVRPAPATRFTVATQMTPAQWDDAVHTALAAIDAGDLEKVVLARTVDIEADQPFDMRAVVSALRRTQPGCVVYADGGFVGASPELLVRKSGDAVVSRPLAGTGQDVEALLGSGKDRHEHCVVVDAVVRALSHDCDTVEASPIAALHLPDVNHLATTVTARARLGVTITDLVDALHPTPAVAGTPVDRARELIGALEPVGRGRYAGPCGWIDARGDGAFVVALRCGELEGARARLHAGAGIVRGSDPAQEWAETQAKLEPMLRVLVRP